MPNRTWFIQLSAEAISEAIVGSQESFDLGAECGVDREPQKEICDDEWKHSLSRDCQTIRDHVTRWGFAEPHRVFSCPRLVSGGNDSSRIRVQQVAAPPPLVAALFFRPKTPVYRRCAASGASLPECGSSAMSLLQQPISGVVPPATAEATVMTVWPSVASTTMGRSLGRLYRIREGFGPVSVGRLALLATIPIGLMLYLSMRLPWAIMRYRLTNRRVMIERGINPKVEQYVDLDRFDAIDLVVSAGQEWYAAGDLVFRRGPIETLRLSGVSRPESFRQTCLKVRQSYVAVASAQREAVGAA
jgi:hypothetical protein